MTATAEGTTFASGTASDPAMAKHDMTLTLRIWRQKSPRDKGRMVTYQVEDIYAFCARLKEKGVTINRPPRDGHMAFVKSPDGISIEILQKGEAKPPQEPWASMENTGSW